MTFFVKLSIALRHLLVLLLFSSVNFTLYDFVGGFNLPSNGSKLIDWSKWHLGVNVTDSGTHLSGHGPAVSVEHGTGASFPRRLGLLHCFFVVELLSHLHFVDETVQRGNCLFHLLADLLVDVLVCSKHTEMRMLLLHEIFQQLHVSLSI